MKKSITAFVTSAMLSIVLIPTTTITSNAKATYNITKLKGEGFRACKAQGDSGYTALVRGTTLNEGSLFNEQGFGKFYVRSCFQTKAECSSYVKNFAKILAGVNEIKHRSCTVRG